MQAPACPRCEYDLSGEPARWEHACPTAGVCSECGIAFDWADVLNPLRWRLPGFYEHERRRRILRAAWRTWWWVFRPWVFWSRVKLHHPVRRRRLFLWPLVLILPLHLFSAAVQFLPEAYAALSGYGRYGRGAAPAPGVDAWSLVCNGAAHLTDPFLSFSVDSALSFRIDRSVLDWTAPVWILLGYALAWPLLMACLPFTRREAKVRWAHVLRAAAYSLGWAVLPWIISLPSEVLQTVFSMRWMLLGSPVTPGAAETAYEIAAWPAQFTERHALSMTGAGLAWLSTWWFFALTRGFRLHSGPWVWAVLLVPALLWAWCISALGEVFLGWSPLR